MFKHLADAVSHNVGKPWAFVLALAAVVLWAGCGPLFGFSDTWQLVINTSTTIVTFLMVFIIQSTQNRDGIAIQAKLDELIRASEARDELIRAEALDESEIEQLRQNGVV